MAKLRASVEAGDHYSALQMYKTQFSRMVSRGKAAEAEALLLRGALVMLQNDALLAGSELATMLLKKWTDDNTQSGAGTESALGQINDAFPKGKEHATFLLSVIKWTKHAATLRHGVKAHAIYGDPEQHFLAAQSWESVGRFANAASHYLHSNRPQAYAKMAYRWSREGYSHERELLLARQTLQLLCMGYRADADKFFKKFLSYSEEGGHVLETPLVTFLEFLLLTLLRDAEPLFKLLQERYSTEIARDPTFKVYLQQIGKRFYNIKPAAADGMAGLMESVMGMLGGGGGQ